MDQAAQSDLLFAAFVSLLGCWYCLSLILTKRTALTIAFLKVALAFVYFRWFFDQSMRLTEDDWGYQQIGLELANVASDPISVLFDKNSFQIIASVVGGQHIFYGWWNFFAHYLFGENYFSPVFLNLIVSCLTGYFFVRLLEKSGFSSLYARGAAIFLLLHPEVLTWTTIYNLKDTIVVLFTVAALYFGLSAFSAPRILSKQCLLPLVGCGLLMWLFQFLRFYVPPFMVATFALWGLLGVHGSKRFVLLGAAVIIFYFLFPAYYPEEIIDTRISVMLYDAIRFLLMPLFWQAWGDPEIGWYALASTVHWILFIPAVISAIKLGPRSRGVMLMLVYMAVITAFYSTVRDLAGHRQRYQLIFIFALCQFDFLQAVWFAFKDHSRRLARWANTAPLPYPSSV